MDAELTGFVRQLTWSDPATDSTRQWRADYVRQLKAAVDDCAAQDRHLADLLRCTKDDDLVPALFCPRVQWAITQANDRHRIAFELSAELSNRLAAQQRSALHSAKEPLCVEGILMDFDSSFDLPGMDCCPAPAPDDRRRVECERIRSALVELRGAFAAPFTFVTRLTTRFAIRSATNSRFSMSGSLTEYPGTILLINPWQARHDLASMIELFVHESTHHAIGLFEATRHKLIVDRATWHQSPWTGNRLTSQQFVEACFVWWGLYQMWVKWPAGSNVPAERAEAQYKRAHDGFLARPVTTLLQSVDSGSVPTDTVDALLSMEQAALANVKTAGEPTPTSATS